MTVAEILRRTDGDALAVLVDAIGGLAA